MAQIPWRPEFETGIKDIDYEHQTLIEAINALITDLQGDVSRAQADRELALEDRFDLAVAVQVLHHVDDLDPVLAGFAEVLEPGGRLCICDLELEDGSFHGEGFGGHHGFDRDELAAQLRAAGFADVAFEHAYDLVRDDHAYPLFLATATR